MSIVGSSQWIFRSRPRFLFLFVLALLVLGTAPKAVLAQPAVGPAAPLSATPSSTQPYEACPAPAPGEAACQAVVEPSTAKIDVFSPASASPATGGISGSGIDPAELQAAYKLPSNSTGSGQTVAIVDAYDDPTAESDLATYRSAYGLPGCTGASGCFTKVNQTGGKTPPSRPTQEDGDWNIEESLDLDMVSAICPDCHIMLVEANTAGYEDLLTAVNEAATLGANEISDSWAGSEFSGETSLDHYLNHPNVPITFASGDDGYESGVGMTSYPAASSDVIAVGGTNLFAAENSRGFSETVWSHSGSGCSQYEAKPSYQTDSGCSHRMTNDVAAVAEDLSIYDTSHPAGSGSVPDWIPVGGTSAATPVIAAVEALSSSATRALGASAFYKNPSSMFDITSGSNGSCGGTYQCTAETGYDGPTGMGTPDGVIAGSSNPSPPTVSSVTPSSGPTAGGTAVTIKGTGFTSGATVTIGGKASAVTVHSAGEITATTAAGTAGGDEVVVSDGNGTSSSGPTYTYVTPPRPTVSSVTPSTGTTAGGTAVVIKGTGFTAGATVTIGSKATAVTVRSASEITAKTVATAAGGDEVTVSEGNGTSSSGPAFTYAAPPAPTVASTSPVKGTTLGGTTVVIKGTGFVTGATVTIGHKVASVTVHSETEMTVTTAATPAGSDEVVVSDSRGTSRSGPTYAYVSPAPPTIRSIAPVKGPTSGGTAVVIKGSGFLPGATVTIGNSKATSVVVRSATEISARTGAGAAGNDEVKVTDPAGSTSKGPTYAYVASPGSKAVASTAIKLVCGAGVPCSGSLQLTVPTVPAAARGSAHPTSIATATFTVAAGRTTVVHLALNATARALLKAGRGRLAATLTVRGRSAGLHTRRLRLELRRRSKRSVAARLSVGAEVLLNRRRQRLRRGHRDHGRRAVIARGLRSAGRATFAAHGCAAKVLLGVRPAASC